ncbi:MAG TPA: hypothetical protein VH309_05110 [Elusimicrobiota bacterium]|nr:hypothetical protein [Elusimicrobiota bacterium]
MKGTPRLETLEVLSVGLPFCVFKLAAGGAFRAFGGAWGAAGTILMALGVVDLLFNGANFAGLVLIRRRVLDACFLSFAARQFQGRARRSRWTLQDLGNSLDVLISFSLVAYMVGAGKLGLLSPDVLTLWDVAVVLNVLGAGLGRFTESVRNLSELDEPKTSP